MAAKTLKYSVSLTDKEVQTFPEGKENQYTNLIANHPAAFTSHWLFTLSIYLSIYCKSFSGLLAHVLVSHFWKKKIRLY